VDLRKRERPQVLVGKNVRVGGIRKGWMQILRHGFNGYEGNGFGLERANRFASWKILVRREQTKYQERENGATGAPEYEKIIGKKIKNRTFL